jgi:hypothetical protein
MAGTNVWRAPRMSARTNATTSTARGRSRRVRTRLWMLLNAPGLLQGGTGSADSARMEDDYHRFAAGPRGY